MDRQELQARRGENQVWNGSGNYAVKPDYLAFDPSGDPELYWNTVTGAAARRSDFTRFQPLLHAFQQQPQGDAYAEVFFLALESAAGPGNQGRISLILPMKAEQGRYIDI